MIRDRHGIDRVNLLGICEGGVFTTCYAALHPDTRQEHGLTITPIDFHGDTARGARSATASSTSGPAASTPEDIDRLIEAHGNAAGRVHGLGVLDDDADAHDDQVQPRLLEVMDDKKKLLNFLRMEKWIADRPHHPGEAAKQWLKDLYQDNKLVKRRVRARRTQGRSEATSPCRC